MAKVVKKQRLQNPFEVPTMGNTTREQSRRRWFGKDPEPERPTTAFEDMPDVRPGTVLGPNNGWPGISRRY